MLRQKFSGSVQEVILPDFPDDEENTVTTTVTKSRRVSFGPNFVKEFIVDSAISAQCMAEYEQPFPSSDSSSAESSHSAVGHSTFVLHENVKVHKAAPADPESAESRPKAPKFASTICFSADSPTADMEFTEGCLTLAKSILDKKNKEMTVFIQAKPKGQKEDDKGKEEEEETNYFEGSQFDMSMTRCMKTKERKREEKRFVNERTKVFARYDDEMSMTRCDKFFNDDEIDANWEESKENRMPLDVIMRHLDKNDSDSDLFNPERSFGQVLGADPFDLSDDSEKLNLNESMEISGGDWQGLKLPADVAQCEDRADEMPAVEPSQKIGSDELAEGFRPEQLSDDKAVDEESRSQKSSEKAEAAEQSSDGKMVAEQILEQKSSEKVKAAEQLFNKEVVTEQVPEQKSSEKADAAEQLSDDKMVTEQVPELESSEKVKAAEQLFDEEMPGLESSERADAAEQSPDDKMATEEVPEQSSEQAKAVASPRASLDVSEHAPPFAEEASPEEMAVEEVMDVEPSPHQPPHPSPPFETTHNAESPKTTPVQEDHNPTEPSLGDLKVIESLKEQSKEEGCVWSLNGVQYPDKKAQGLLTFSCRLLESTATVEFMLKMSDEDSLDSCSIVTDSNIYLEEEKQCRLPEYSLAVGFGFEELKKYFGSWQTVESVRHVPYYMDQVNSFLSKMKAYLRQIHSVLSSYPGSRLRDCRLSFRLFSFPIFFSCVVSIDLSNVFRLSRASLTFEHDFGCLDEKRVEEIFEECLKGENSLCEFVVQSTRYLVDLERQSGWVSKRNHIGLLPDELKS